MRVHFRGRQDVSGKLILERGGGHVAEAAGVGDCKAGDAGTEEEGSSRSWAYFKRRSGRAQALF
jgi:hypothetical protein